MQLLQVLLFLQIIRYTVTAINSWSGNTAYDLSVPAPTAAKAPVEFMSFKLKKTGANSSPWVMSRSSYTECFKFKNTYLFTDTSGSTMIMYYEITISDFQTTANDSFKVYTQGSYLDIMQVRFILRCTYDSVLIINSLLLKL